MSLPDKDIERPATRAYCDVEGCHGTIDRETGYCLTCEIEEHEEVYKELCKMLDYYNYKGWEVS